MPRKRYYNPIPKDLTKNKRFFLVRPESARLFMLLYAEADDFGNQEADAALLSRVLYQQAPGDFPEATVASVESCLSDLASVQLILRYTTSDGRSAVHLVDHVQTLGEKFHSITPPTKAQLATLKSTVVVEGDLFTKANEIAGRMYEPTVGNASATRGTATGEESGSNGEVICKQRGTRDRTRNPNPRPSPTRPNPRPKGNGFADSDSAGSKKAGMTSASDFGSDITVSADFLDLFTCLCRTLKLSNPFVAGPRSPRKSQAKADRTDLERTIIPAILSVAENDRGVIDEAKSAATKAATAERPMAAFKHRLKALGILAAKGTAVPA